MAPFAALTPYNAVAAAPFKTVKLAMSSGFISPALLAYANCDELPTAFEPELGKTFPENVSLSIASPSTIING